jgi:hypothetical protein
VLASRAHIALILAGAGAASMILVLGSRLTFWGDEWNFLLRQPLAPIDFLRPNNEHWATVPFAVYSLLMWLGARTYLPFMAVLVGAHLATAAGMYTLIRPRTGQAWAVALTTVLLFLGSGAEDLLWAWQMGFVGACAFGVWALVALDRGRPGVAALLLTLGLATHGPGLFFLVAALAASARRRRMMAWLAVPLAVYATWFLTFGRLTIGALQNPFTLSSAVSAPWFAAQGIVHAVGGVTGLGVAGIGLLFAMIAAAVRWRAEPLFWGGLAGVAAEFLLVGLVRSGIEGSMTMSRYVYPAAVLLLISAACVIPKVTRPSARLILGVLIVVAVTTNALTLVAYGLSPPYGRFIVSQPYGCLPPTIPAQRAGLTVTDSYSTGRFAC